MIALGGLGIGPVHVRPGPEVHPPGEVQGQAQADDPATQAHAGSRGIAVGFLQLRALVAGILLMAPAGHLGILQAAQVLTGKRLATFRAVIADHGHDPSPL